MLSSAVAVDVLRLGFAGLGEAATLVLPEITRLPYIRVTAAADVRPQALDRFEAEYKGETFRSVEELCTSSSVDAIYVATPHELHAQHTILALESGKHVIVEKPMALAVADAEKMNQVAERRGMKLLCGHTKSFDPPIRKMRALIREGRIGPLRMIHTWNYNDFMVRPYPNREMEVSRGVVLNQGPHQIDIVRLLGGGMVRSVRAMTGAWDETRPEGAYTCYLEFEDRAVATIVFSSYGYFDTAELTWWLGEAAYPGRNQDSRRAFNRIRGPNLERRLEELKEGVRYGVVHGTLSTTCNGPGVAGVPCDAGAAGVKAAVTTYATVSLNNTAGMTVTPTYPDGTSKPSSRVRVVVSYNFQPLFGLGWPTVTVNAASEGRITF